MCVQQAIWQSRKARQGKKNQAVNQTETYYFDVEKRKVCPLRDVCYKDGARTKSYSISIKSELHKEQMTFQDTDYYRNKYKGKIKN